MDFIIVTPMKGPLETALLGFGDLIGSHISIGKVP